MIDVLVDTQLPFQQFNSYMNVKVVQKIVEIPQVQSGGRRRCDQTAMGGGEAFLPRKCRTPSIRTSTPGFQGSGSPR